MIVVAIETATVEVGVALAGPAGLLAAFTARPGRRHVETLHPALEAVCAAAGTSLADVDAVAVDVGPGLFTGIRVGVAAAKALAFGLGVPAVACLSTEVLAHACRDVALDVVPVVDMRRGEVAWSGPGDAAAGVSPGPAGLRLGTVEQLAEALVAHGRPVLLVGDGARRHGDRLAEAVAALGGAVPSVAGDELAAPPVASLAELGARRAADGCGVSAVELAPVYLRPPDAKINWTSREPDPSADPAPAVASTPGLPATGALDAPAAQSPAPAVASTPGPGRP